MDNKPVGITIITILLIILGAYFLMQGFLAFGSSMFGIYMPLDDNTKFLASILALLIGMFLIGLAVSTYQLEKWAWSGALTLSIIGAVLDVILLANNAGVIPGISLLLSLTIIVYLTRPSIKSQFVK